MGGTKTISIINGYTISSNILGFQYDFINIGTTEHGKSPSFFKFSAKIAGIENIRLGIFLDENIQFDYFENEFNEYACNINKQYCLAYPGHD